MLSATDALAGWAGTDLRRRPAPALLGVPVTVINDVHAHALGEARHGVAAGHDTVLYVAVGTGVGASFVLDGHRARRRALRGRARRPPAVAVRRKLPCTCGGRGHLEAIAAGPALTAEYVAAYRPAGRPTCGPSPRAPRTATRRPARSSCWAARPSAPPSAAWSTCSTPLPSSSAAASPASATPGGARCATPCARETLPSLADVPVLASTLGPDAPLLGAASLAWKVS